MQLSSARALRDQLLAKPATQEFATSSSLPLAARLTASALPVARPPSPFAVGVVGKGRSYRLAVRIQTLSPGLEKKLEEIRELAKGEVDVRQVGRLVKQAKPWHQSRNRPLKIGGSIGHYQVTAGTLGCFVTKIDGDGTDLILSNNHVLANENNADKGDPILQPGAYDGGKRPKDIVGKLSHFIRLRKRNAVDAAVASIEPGMEYFIDVLQGLGTIRGVRTERLDEGEKVFKVGRTTGVTEGVVRAVEMMDLEIGYDMGDILFDEQIEIAPAGNKPFSLGGDSGSLIVDQNHYAVGLLFAGNDVDATYANPIGTVLSDLNVKLVY